MFTDIRSGMRDLLLGLPTYMAEKIIREKGFELRILRRDGVEYSAEMDEDSGRANVYIDNDKVSDFRGFF